jgi:hypothetical protein
MLAVIIPSTIITRIVRMIAILMAPFLRATRRSVQRPLSLVERSSLMGIK